MTLTQQTSTPVVTSGEIKFSELRKQFKTISPRTTYGGSEDFSGDSDAISISASELLRSTNTSVSNPIVGDSTENASISSANNWKTSQLRNSIKYYFAQQTGSNTDVDGDTNITWNSNLHKTIKKFFFIEGIIGSTDPSNSALEFDTAVVNLKITLESGSQIRGAGGTGGTESSKNGKVGGNALTFSSTTNGLEVHVKSSSQLKSGGGGGGFGGTGGYTSATTGSGSYASNYQTYELVHGTTNKYTLRDDGGALSCSSATNKPSNATNIGCANGFYNGAGGVPRSANNIAAPWATCQLCVYSYTAYNAGATQAGTDGGRGEGHQQTRTSGEPASNNAGSGGLGGVYGSPGSDGTDGVDVNAQGHDVTGSPGGLAGFAISAPSYTLIEDGTVLGRKS